MKVMFVCTGNTCRSPMAEAIFKSLSENAEVYSAGISAVTGDRASFKSIQVCKKHGLDLSGHRALNVNNSKIAEMDLVLTAEEFHRDVLLGSYPNLDIRTIKQYAGGYENLDISDPVNGNEERYEKCFLEIKEALEKIVNNHNL